MGRYPDFFQCMAGSPSSEVSLMAALAAQDARTVTASSLALVINLSKLDCATAGGKEVKQALPVQEGPKKEGWRLGLLDALLREQAVMEQEGKESKRVVAMVSSLCST